MTTSRILSRLLWSVSTLLLLLGCAALTQYGRLEREARQHYQRGDYDQAVFKCAASLKTNPQYDKAQLLIRDAFRAAVNMHQDMIQQLESSGGKFKWDRIASEYEALVKLNQTIKSLPTLVDKKTRRLIRFELGDYAEALAETKTNAAEAHYQEGLRLSQKKGVDFQKQAAKEFKAAQQFRPDYKDSARRYQSCRQAGIKRVAIIPFEDKSGKRGRYGAVSEMITDQIISQVMSDPSAMEFLELISRDQLEHIMREQQLEMSDLVDEQTAVRLGRLMGVHKILTGKITQIITVPARTVKKPEKQKARVVVKTEKYTDSKGKKKKRYIWGDVEATVTFYTRTAGASIVGSYKIIDVETARIERSESFTGESKFKYEWATHSGDERALDRKASELVKKGERPAPTAEQLVNQAAENLSTSLAKSLKEYSQ